jgi:hypothetical protein
MVTVANYSLKTGKDGKPFVALELQGDMELVQSMGTGRFYATAKKCTITSTFDEPTAKTLIGKQISGTIQRVETEPYEYTVPETGEVILLQHTYTYVPELRNGAPSKVLEAV